MCVCVCGFEWRTNNKFTLCNSQHFIFHSFASIQCYCLFVSLFTVSFIHFFKCTEIICDVERSFTIHFTTIIHTTRNMCNEIENLPEPLSNNMQSKSDPNPFSRYFAQIAFSLRIWRYRYYQYSWTELKILLLLLYHLCDVQTEWSSPRCIDTTYTLTYQNVPAIEMEWKNNIKSNIEKIANKNFAPLQTD